MQHGNSQSASDCGTAWLGLWGPTQVVSFQIIGPTLASSLDNVRHKVTGC